LLKLRVSIHLKDMCGRDTQHKATFNILPLYLSIELKAYGTETV